MKKWFFPFFIGMLCCFLLLSGLYLFKNKNILKISFHKDPSRPAYQERNYHLRPGNVANVFGWGYNRSSCFLPSQSQTVQFFFAEDNHLYYALSSTMHQYTQLDFPLLVNPDFDVHCLADEVIALTFSDLDQHIVFYGELIWKNNELEWQNIQLAGDGGDYRSAVAPTSRILDKTRFVSYMSFGYPGTTRNSEANVVWSDLRSVNPFGSNAWHKQKLFSIRPEISQIMGISLENYKDSLIAILVHPDSTVYFSFFDKEKQVWGQPIKQPIHIAGHLEWKTLATENAVYFVYRNLDQKLEIAKLIADTFEVTSLDQLSLNSLSIFENNVKEVFLMYNDSVLRKISPSVITTPIALDASTSASFYFGQVSAQVGDSIFYSSVGGVDGKYTIDYRLKAWPSEQSWHKDETAITKVMPLAR